MMIFCLCDSANTIDMKCQFLNEMSWVLFAKSAVFIQDPEYYTLEFCKAGMYSLPGYK